MDALARMVRSLALRVSELEYRLTLHRRGGFTEADRHRFGSAQGSPVYLELYAGNAAGPYQGPIADEHPDTDAESPPSTAFLVPRIGLKLLNSGPRLVYSEDGGTEEHFLAGLRTNLLVSGDLSGTGPFLITDDLGVGVRVEWAVIVMNGLTLQPTSYGPDIDEETCQYEMISTGGGFTTTIPPQEGSTLWIPIAYEKL